MNETLVDDTCGTLAATDDPKLSIPDRAAKTSRTDVIVLSFNVNQ